MWVSHEGQRQPLPIKEVLDPVGVTLRVDGDRVPPGVDDVTAVAQFVGTDHFDLHDRSCSSLGTIMSVRYV